MTLTLSDEQRSMIAGIVCAGMYGGACLCCGDDALRLCVEIVGREHAPELHNYAYESLGCDYLPEDNSTHIMEQEYLDRVSTL